MDGSSTVGSCRLKALACEDHAIPLSVTYVRPFPLSPPSMVLHSSRAHILRLLLKVKSVFNIRLCKIPTSAFYKIVMRLTAARLLPHWNICRPASLKSWPPLKLCGEGRQQTAVHQSDLGAGTWFRGMVGWTVVGRVNQEGYSEKARE